MKVFSVSMSPNMKISLRCTFRSTTRINWHTRLEENKQTNIQEGTSHYIYDFHFKSLILNTTLRCTQISIIKTRILSRQRVEYTHAYRLQPCQSSRAIRRSPHRPTHGPPRPSGGWRATRSSLLPLLPPLLPAESPALPSPARGNFGTLLR